MWRLVSRLLFKSHELAKLLSCREWVWFFDGERGVAAPPHRLEGLGSAVSSHSEIRGDGVGRVLNSNLELNHDMTSFVGLPVTWYVTHESRWTPSTVDYFTFFYVRFLWLAVEAIRQLHGARHCLHPVCLKSWLHLRCNNTTVWNAERAPFKSDATTGGIKAWLYWPTSLSYLASNSYFYISMKSMQRSRAGNKRTKIVLTLAFIMNDELQRVVQCSCGCELVAEIGSCISTVYTVRRMLYSIIARELVHEIPEAPGSLREYRWWNGKWLPIL